MKLSQIQFAKSQANSVSSVKKEQNTNHNLSTVNENYAKIPLATYQNQMVSFGICSCCSGGSCSVSESKSDWKKRQPYGYKLHQAVQNNDLKTVKDYILNKGADVNCLATYNESLLYDAVCSDDEIMDFLLSRPDIDPNVQFISEGSDCADYISPLFRAIRRGKYYTIEKLLSHPKIDVNQFGDYNKRYNALGCMIDDLFYDKTYATMVTPEGIEELENYKRKYLNLLLSRPDIDVNQQNERGESAIFIAARKRDSQAIKILLESGKVDLNVKNNKGQDIKEYIKQGYLMDVDCIVNSNKKSFYKTYGTRQALLDVFDNYEVKEFEPKSLLPENNVYSSQEITKKFTAMIGAKDGKEKALKLLHDTPLVDFDSDDKAAIKAVLLAGDPDFAKSVFEYMILEQPKQREEYDKKRAAFLNSLQFKSYDELLKSPFVLNTEDGFEYLISKINFDPNQKIEKTTLFGRACELDPSGKLAKLILERYEDVDTSGVIAKSETLRELIEDYNQTGKYTVKLSNARLNLVKPDKRVQALADLKDFVKSDEFRPDMAATNGNNILHILANSSLDGTNEVIKLSLKKGVDVNSQNSFGQTPLMIALKTVKRMTDKEQRRCVFAIISFLIKNGASVTVTDVEGKTPLHYACASTSPTALKLVLDQEPNLHQKDKSGKLAKVYLSDDDMKQVYREYFNQCNV